MCDSLTVTILRWGHEGRGSGVEKVGEGEMGGWMAEQDRGREGEEVC